MKNSLVKLARCALAVSVVLPLAVQVAGAAEAKWPSKPVRLIVPFAPGGGTDIIARTLGVTTEKHIDAFPGVPAIAEVVPGFVAEHWYGIWGTPGTPPDIIARVNKAVGGALQAQDLRDRIIADGFTPAYSSTEEYRKRLEKDVARWKDVVKKANIRIDVIG